MIIPFPHQEDFADKCWDLLKELGYVYLAGKPRSGKTLIALLTAEKSDKINNVLILTKLRAIGYPEKLDSKGLPEVGSDGLTKLVRSEASKYYIRENEGGWLKFLHNYPLRHNYTVTNYEQAKKLKATDYDLVIIDESHNLGPVGKMTSRVADIKKLCYDMPHIHLSGTAIVETPNSIYHQMCISKYTPFLFKNFYEYFRFNGKPYYIKINGVDRQQYDKANFDVLMPQINEFTVYMTQNDAGISDKLQAVDKLHYIKLNDDTRKLYNSLQKDLIETVEPGMFSSLPRPFKHLGDITEYELVCDSTMKLRTSLHMLESGVAKIGDTYIELGNTEKIDYIKKEFGDEAGVGIMCHFIGERNLLTKHFKYASIYSSSAHAEGVDLSHLKYFIILSADYSGSKFIQRRDRIVNLGGSNTLTVHHILVKKAISDQVYKKVSKKEDFNNSTYDAISI